MERKSRKFHLGTILTIVVGKLLSPRLMDGVYDILNYMTSDNLYTHQLPRAADECKYYLLLEMPWLNEIDDSSVNGENYETWLNDQVKKYGEYHTIYPIHSEDHKRIDPIEELKQMGVDEDKIITIDVTEDEPPNPIGDIGFSKN